MSDPSQNEIVSAVAADLIKASFNSITKGISGYLKDTWDKIFEDFAPYMEEIYNRNNFVRIISSKDKDIKFEEIYVETKFISNDELYTDNQLISKISEGDNLVITGDGGAGKTFFMRHLWLELFKLNYKYTPIFLELRRLNSLTDFDIETFIRLSISQKADLTEKLFESFCRNGRFCFLLDGFDELDVGLEDVAQAQITLLSAKYPSCTFVVSSRHDARFSGWQNFECYRSEPFDYEQVKNLLEKIPFDKKIKKSFRNLLSESFYETNKEFLSNPLLAIMMLMTYRDNMNIPKKMSIFYDDAFTTLYQWHDATKAYSRKKSLSIEQFQRSFGIFCLLSYYNQKYEFSKTEIINYINKSNKVCNISINAEDVLNDYVRSVCLMRQEGFYFIFIHRSFQEYFTAFAMMRVVPDKLTDFFPAFERRLSDSVLVLCLELDQPLFVKKYILPGYNNLINLDLLKNKKLSPFFCLENLPVSYVCTFKFDEDAGTYQLYSYGIASPSQNTSFIENTCKIMLGIQKSGFLTEMQKILLSFKLAPNIFDDNFYTKHLDHENKIEENLDEIFVYLSVESNKLCIQGNNQAGNTSLVCDHIVDLFENNRRELETQFEEIDNHLHKLIKKTGRYCQKLINEVQEPGKSLEDILDL